MNNRGIALILCYMVILVLTIFASAFVTSTISENTVSTRQNDSTSAFWIAEAGLNQAYYNWKNGIPQPTSPVNFSAGTYTVDASNLLEVKVTGTFGRSNAQRTIQASFVAIPEPFQNTLSTGGNLEFTIGRGLPQEDKVRPISLKVNGKSRISGKYIFYNLYGFTGTAWFEDKKENVNPDDTTLKIPDYNHNGKPDEYDDFVQMGRKIVASYPANEVIYLKTNSTIVLNEQSEISGKKVIFVEGKQEYWGGGVYILNPSLNAGDDITVISTYFINPYIPLQPTNTRFSTISWGYYSEGATQGSEQRREGINYTHGMGKWSAGWSLPSSLIIGNVIANKGQTINIPYGGTDLQFGYSDRMLKGDIPPGFKWLFGTKGERKLMVDWQEAE